MSQSLAKARASWVGDGDDDHAGDVALLCQGGSVCGSACRMDGFCFRGLGSAEVRSGVERRLQRIEQAIGEMERQAMWNESQRSRFVGLKDECRTIRDNFLQFPVTRK